MYPNKGLAQYRQVASMGHSPIKQIAMLYEGAIRFLHLAALDIETNDIAAKAEHSNRALDILNYLRTILDFEAGGEVATVLNNLYREITGIVLKASSQLNARLMRHAAQLLMPVAEAWTINAQTQQC